MWWLRRAIGSRLWSRFVPRMSGEVRHRMICAMRFFSSRHGSFENKKVLVIKAWRGTWIFASVLCVECVWADATRHGSSRTWLLQSCYCVRRATKVFFFGRAMNIGCDVGVLHGPTSVPQSTESLCCRAPILCVRLVCCVFEGCVFLVFFSSAEISCRSRHKL